MKKLRFLALSLFIPTLLVPSLLMVDNVNLINNKNETSVLDEAINDNQQNIKENRIGANNFLQTNYGVSGTKYEFAQYQPVNTKPWKRLIGNKSIVNIQESSNSNKLKVLYTMISNDGINSPPTISSEWIDFSNVQEMKNANRLYFAGGTYCEELGLYVLIINGVFNLSGTKIKTIPYVVTLNDIFANDETDIVCNKISKLKINDTDYLEIQDDKRTIDHDFKVVPFYSLKTSSYKVPTFLVYPYSDKYYLSDLFNTEDKTRILSTTFSLNGDSDVTFYPTLLKNKNLYEYYKRTDKDSSILSLRPIFYSNHEDPLLLILKSHNSESSYRDINSFVLHSMKNEDPKPLLHRDVITYRLDSNNQILAGNKIQWYVKLTNKNASFLAPYIEIFDANIKQGGFYNEGFVASFNLMGDNADASGLINLAVGLNVKNNQIESYNASNVRDLSFNLQNDKLDIDIASLWFDMKNKRIIFYASWYKNGSNNVEKNKIIMLNYEEFMNYSLPKEQNGVFDSNNLTTNFAEFYKNNFLSSTFTEEDGRIVNTVSKNDPITNIEYYSPSIVYVNGNIFYGQPKQKKFSAITTFIDQTDADISNSNASYSFLDSNSLPSEISVEKIKKEVGANNIFKFYNIPVKKDETIDSAKTNYNNNIEITNVIANDTDGTLTFQIKNTKFNEKFKLIDTKENIQELESLTQFRIKGFKKAQYEIKDVININDFQNNAILRDKLKKRYSLDFVTSVNKLALINDLITLLNDNYKNVYKNSAPEQDGEIPLNYFKINENAIDKATVSYDDNKNLLLNMSYLNHEKKYINKILTITGLNSNTTVVATNDSVINIEQLNQFNITDYDDNPTNPVKKFIDQYISENLATIFRNTPNKFIEFNKKNLEIEINKYITEQNAIEFNVYTSYCFINNKYTKNVFKITIKGFNPNQPTTTANDITLKDIVAMAPEGSNLKKAGDSYAYNFGQKFDELYKRDLEVLMNNTCINDAKDDDCYFFNNMPIQNNYPMIKYNSTTCEINNTEVILKFEARQRKLQNNEVPPNYQKYSIKITGFNKSSTSLKRHEIKSESEEFKQIFGQSNTGFYVDWTRGIYSGLNDLLIKYLSDNKNKINFFNTPEITIDDIKINEINLNPIDSPIDSPNKKYVATVKFDGYKNGIYTKNLEVNIEIKLRKNPDLYGVWNYVDGVLKNENGQYIIDEDIDIVKRKVRNVVQDYVNNLFEQGNFPQSINRDQIEFEIIQYQKGFKINDLKIGNADNSITVGARLFTNIYEGSGDQSQNNSVFGKTWVWIVIFCSIGVAIIVLTIVLIKYAKRKKRTSNSW